MGDVKKLGTALNRYRRERMYSLRQLGVMANLSHQAISAIEKGETQNPDPGTINQLERALNLPLGTLLIEAGYVDPPTRHSRLASLAMHLFDQLPEEHQVRLLKRLQIEFELIQEEMGGNR